MEKPKRHYRYHIIYNGKFLLSAKSKKIAEMCRYLPIMNYLEYPNVKIIDTKTNKEIKEV